MPGPCWGNTSPALLVLEQHITSLAGRHISLPDGSSLKPTKPLWVRLASGRLWEGLPGSFLAPAFLAFSWDKVFF